MTACFSDSADNGSVDKNDDGSIAAIYDLYAEKLRNENKTPLSYDEWLATIKGEKGDRGEQGIQGEKGEKGDQGEQGIQGEKGADGRGIVGITYKDGIFTVLYTDGTIEEITISDTSEGTEGLDFYLLPDGTYGVKVGTAIYSEEIVIPETYKGKSVTEILDSAFKGARQLKSVKLPRSILKLGNEAFAECYKLSNLNIPSSVIYIGSKALYGIENAFFEDENEWMNIVRPSTKYSYSYYSYDSGYPDSTAERYAIDNNTLIKILSQNITVTVKQYSSILIEAGCRDEVSVLKIYEKVFKK